MPCYVLCWSGSQHPAVPGGEALSWDKLPDTNDRVATRRDTTSIAIGRALLGSLVYPPQMSLRRTDLADPSISLAAWKMLGITIQSRLTINYWATTTDHCTYHRASAPDDELWL